VLPAVVLCLVMGAAHGAAADVQALMTEGKLEQALAQVERELAADRANVTLQFLKGLALTRLNRLDAAAETFQRITEEHPELPEPYNNLAVVHAARGDFEAAQQALQKAINTHPSYATAHENLGDIYARMASEAYNHALQLDQTNASAKTKLALINDLFPVPTVNGAAAASPAPARGASSVPRDTAAPSRVSAVAKEAPVATTAVAAAPAPIETPESAGPASTSGPSVTDEVRRTVEQWAAAWSAQDVDAYLAFYDADFTPADGSSRGRWERTRRIRLTAPRYIRVSVSDPIVIEHGPEHVQVSFDQRYESDAFTDTVRKTLILKKSGSDWRIVEEALR
jgi:tetratricopeptide (TPR) repeat protein